MKYIAAMALSAGLAIAGGANATVNLVQNGGFETLTDSAYYNHEFGQATTGYWANKYHYHFGDDVADWSSPSTTAYNIWFSSATAATTTNAIGEWLNIPAAYGGQTGQDLYSVPTGDPNGGAFLGLDGYGSASGPVQQTINNLVKNAKYTLTFYWATAQLQDRSGATTDTITASLCPTNTTCSQSVTSGPVTNPSGGSTGWYKVTDTFTASGSSDVLSFLASGTPGNLPPMVLLDGVSLTAVPEPATWAMMLVGFGAIGYGLRRRRAAVLAA
jgi:hypothetical protein